MNSRKKQTVAVAMATALGASAMMSPVAVHAQEEDLATAITQEGNHQDSMQETNPKTEQTNENQTVEQADYTNQKQEEEINAESILPENQLNQIENQENRFMPFLADNGVMPTSTDVEINVTNFPDDTFRDYVNSNFNNNPRDGVLSQDEISKITNISVNGITAIKSLKGIEHFFALKHLICSKTGITKLDISMNSNLWRLDCYDNPNLDSLTLKGADALEVLSCYNTGITELDVSNNTSLKTLVITNTEITELDVSKNINLETLWCYDTKIKKLDVSENENLTSLYCYNNLNLVSLDVGGADALNTLYCYSTGIKTLDVSKNINLETLYCYSNSNLDSLNVDGADALKYLYCFATGITELDVSNNALLKILSCYSTGIKLLDVSSNTHLTELNCHHTKITKLDVSNNNDLDTLYCNNTGITELDVSNNPALTYLNCLHTPLAWLNLGNQVYLNKLTISPSVVDLAVTSDSFDMTQAFQGIDISKVTNITGATLDGNSITGYTLGKPITYTYGCGTAQGNSVTLDVTLNLVKSDSTIQITGSLDMTYTGKTIVNPSVSSTGSKGAVTFTYEKWNGSAWEVFSEMPMDAGRYRVQAHLASDDFNNEAVSEKKEFTITQAINSWKNEPAIADWTYGGQPNSPTATAKFGNPIFTYSDSKSGAFTSDAPVNAGTWYVKATVVGTNNYTGLESIHPFTILPKNIKDGNITVSDIKNDSDVKKLSVKDDDRALVKGTDYDVETKKAGNKTTVTIAFKGNYTGTIERTYTVATSQPEKPEQKPQQDKPQEKPKDSTQANSKEKPKNTEHVKTGDTTQTGLFATLSMMSAGCIALLAGKKRKKSMKEDETTTQ